MYPPTADAAISTVKLCCPFVALCGTGPGQRLPWPTTAVVAIRCLPLNSSVVIAGLFTMVEEQWHHPGRGLGSRSSAEADGREAVKLAACGIRAWDEAVCGSSCEVSPGRLGWHIPLSMFSLLAGLGSHLHRTSAGQPLQ